MNDQLPPTSTNSRAYIVAPVVGKPLTATAADDPVVGPTVYTPRLSLPTVVPSHNWYSAAPLTVEKENVADVLVRALPGAGLISAPPVAACIVRGR